MQLLVLLVQQILNLSPSELKTDPQSSFIGGFMFLVFEKQRGLSGAANVESTCWCVNKDF